ncbi:YraN family protein [Nocardioides sp. Kera G14]|uniref:YraN family protein n=1 Tax=Nocardioides sp. Kera G14 TaxID=2884264 RepID=UPI001D12A28C|nr:YraN family protein [Nocardioides sp. Kera G14]UDY22636.1 YraN family protein [Nocardioides sp. Kera G14]
MTSTAAQRTELGAFGEHLAEETLVKQGMVLLDRNWRCSEGELDLVLRDGPDLVACEVKTRSGLWCGTPHEAVTPAKLERLRRLGARWALDHGLRPPGIRVDVVAIVRPRRGEARIDHVKGLL